MVKCIFYPWGPEFPVVCETNGLQIWRTEDNENIRYYRIDIYTDYSFYSPLMDRLEEETYLVNEASTAAAIAAALERYIDKHGYKRGE